MSAMVAFVSLAGLVAVVLAGLNERRRELAVLRAVGAAPRHVMLMLAAEGGTVTLLGVVLGVIATAVVITAAGPMIQSRFGILPALLKDLYARNIGSILVEGGTRTIQSFIDAGLWDEAWRFTAPVNFSEGIREPSFESEAVTTEDIGGDRLEIFRNPESASL